MNRYPSGNAQHSTQSPHVFATAMAIAAARWRSLAILAPTTLLSTALLGLSAPVLADHDPEHSIANLKGGLGALEQRVWDCERGVNGKCPGTKGDTGETGPQGPQGETGATGAQGPQGEIGPIGPQGATGAQGPQGDTGPTGAQGPQGEVGPTGPQGATGAQGPQGETGATGAQGPQGEVGPIGPQGDTGAQGPQGENGEQGEPGLSGWEKIEKSCTSSGSTLSCTAICSDGKQVLGGGVSNSNTVWLVVQSYPTTEAVTGNSSWTVTLNRQNGNSSITVITYALCAITN